MLTGHDSTNAERKLDQSGQTPSDGWMGDFGLIDWDDHDQDTDAQPPNDPPGVEVCEGARASLEGASETEDQRPHDDGPSSAESVR